jgi:hypothetical protein
MKKLKLKDLIEQLETLTEEHTYCYNTKTGEIVFVSELIFRAIEMEDDDLDGYYDWEKDEIELAIEIDKDLANIYIPLPSIEDIGEYSIMEDFCYQLKDKKIREKFLNDINGKGAFRRFDENLEEYDLEQQWHEYKKNALKEIAIEWCEENNIEFE